MTSPDRPGSETRAIPPLPKERWKGPPGGIPDEERPRGKGCLTPLIMVGSLGLMAWGLYAAIYLALVPRWTMGGYFGFFLAGLAAVALGACFIGYGRGRRPPRPRTFVASVAREGLTALLGFIGLLLLLPGLCSLLFGSSALSLPEGGDMASQGMILTGLLAGAAGITLITWDSIPSGAAGLVLATGLLLLIPGAYAVLYGFSRLYWINHLQSPLLPIGLPAGVIGILYFRAARQRMRDGASVDPPADPPGSAPHS
ncbi:hypothetical protein ACQR1Y_19145 [Bradyrhizobium sp. HKCCYLRH3099]|uniref:hypothetical protein n=1 Tax=unclassified Bradyrhizobium TaxID=2631580 RepID=UPI003EBA4D95